MKKTKEVFGSENIKQPAHLCGASASAPDLLHHLSRVLALIAQPPTSPAAAPYAFRLPKAKSTDPYFGGARGWWNARILPCEANNFSPPVKSFVDKAPGARRGVRFILFESAKEYFQKLANGQSTPTEPAGTSASAAAA